MAGMNDESNIAPQQIPYFFNKLLEKQGLEYKDGKIMETKQESEETKPKHLFLKKDMSFEDGKLYRCTKIKSKDKIAYVSLEEVKNNPKEVEYSTMLQSIWGKVCELEGKLGDIYNAISKPYQPYQDIPQKQEWSIEESYINNAIAACRSLYGEYSETAHWLESLKDRVQPQPKQEWSEEDEEMAKVKYYAKETDIEGQGLQGFSLQ